MYATKTHNQLSQLSELLKSWSYVVLLFLILLVSSEMPNKSAQHPTRKHSILLNLFRPSQVSVRK